MKIMNEKDVNGATILYVINGLFGTIWKIIALSVLMLSWYGSAHAAVITFASTSLGGNRWLYEYMVSASASEPAIEEFTIYFSPGRYDNLTVESSPGGWDSIVVQPDAAVPADGFFDSLTLGKSIGPGESRSGFSVSFDFMDTGAPGQQRFDIVDPISFSSIFSGMTSPADTAPPSDVPEPSTIFLLAIGLGFLLIGAPRLRHGIAEI